jgi:hypothetical protein
MVRTALAVACVALLTVTAGCGGLFGADGTTTRDPFGVGPTPTATATATPGPGAGASAAFRRAVANHTEALRAAGNFTIRRTLRSGRVIDGVEPERIGTLGRIDLDAERYAFGRVGTGTDGATVESYQNATAWYRKVDGRWRNFSEGLGGGEATPRRIALQRMAAPPNRSARFPLERNGTATFDGEEMARYTATDPGAFRGRFVDVRTVTSFHATVLVDDRGIVRRFSYGIRGRTVANATVVENETVTVTDVGNTDVAPLSAIPDRIGRASAYREAVANHTATLREAGNFTVRRVRRSGPVGGTDRTVGSVVALDLDADRYRSEQWQADGDGNVSRVAYRNATGVYATGPDGGFENVTGSGAVLDPRGAGLALAQRAHNASVVFPLEPAGTTALDGERVGRFLATDPGDFRGRGVQLRTVTRFQAVALVDDRGIVRRFRYTIRGETYGGETRVETVTIAVTDVGETTVEPPAGLANATDAGGDA